jgi:hypothetical protein
VVGLDGSARIANCARQVRCRAFSLLITCPVLDSRSLRRAGPHDGAAVGLTLLLCTLCMRCRWLPPSSLTLSSEEMPASDLC